MNPQRKQMSIEVKGLIAGLAAGMAALIGVVGITFIVRTTVTTPAPPPRPKYTQTSLLGKNPSLVVLGKTFYAASCASCHGDHGSGNIGPALKGNAYPAPVITQTVTNGRGDMPAFGSTYSPKEISAIAAYVETLK